ncbi:hypothetical protein CBLAS_0579 [Campylobacter blaseri]|uniref:Pentapeptide repeat-containing protein n=1 Tax=Campylobacter blaseri TaxID=2042961 RepID=A0A2P8R071_9BACT|nr:pentapeptide repeat-containing protein [Campylobacter blaseri]PSM51890.1 hypothetical protein CQ405_04815 [Campylobacter blaseri]PSM53674.1 hypothetical protein CRN67_04815 [Campylobacter blaseri]QKF85772.1 hypothetical protein CBLAS_0579 [Campylobacter blaseri]
MNDKELKEILEAEFLDIRCYINNDSITISPESITHRPFEIKWFKKIEDILATSKPKSSITFRYFIFLDEVDLINHQITFENCAFNYPFNIDSKEYNKALKFKNCQFNLEENLIFDNNNKTNFINNIQFLNCNFNSDFKINSQNFKKLEFKDCIFNEDIKIDCCKIHNLVFWNTRHSEVIFNKEINFDNTKLNDVDFIDYIFTKYPCSCYMSKLKNQNYTNCKFNFDFNYITEKDILNLKFENCIFTGNVNFNNTEFNQNLSFKNSKFEKEFRFENVKFLQDNDKNK